jgi:hypothetical protein
MSSFEAELILEQRNPRTTAAFSSRMTEVIGEGSGNLDLPPAMLKTQSEAFPKREPCPSGTQNNAESKPADPSKPTVCRNRDHGRHPRCWAKNTVDRNTAGLRESGFFSLEDQRPAFVSLRRATVCSVGQGAPGRGSQPKSGSSAARKVDCCGGDEGFR